MIKLTLMLLKLSLFAAVAIVIDFFFFAFTKTCVSCESFSQFLSSSYSLFATTWASLMVVVYQAKHKNQQ